MKILHVSNGYPLTDRGGVAEYVRLLSHELGEKNEVTVFAREWTYQGNQYNTRSVFDGNVGIDYITNNIAYPSDFSLSYTNNAIDKIFEAELLKRRPDVIHFHHLLGLSGNLPVIARKLNIPFLFTIHDYWYICPCTRLYTRQKTVCLGGNPECVKDYFIEHPKIITQVFSNSPNILKDVIPTRLKREIKSIIMMYLLRHKSSSISFILAKKLIQERMEHFRKILNLGKKILVPSEFARIKCFEFGIEKKRIVKSPLGIDIGHLGIVKKTPSSIIRFAYLGYLEEFKGVDILIEAFNAVNGNVASLTIYGDQKTNPAYFRKLKKTAKHKNIFFAGTYNREDLPGIFTGIDVVIIPSLCPESFNLVAREAQAAKIPIIASAIGGLTETVKDGVNGYIFPPGDIKNLFRKINYVSGNPQIIKKFSFNVPRPASIKEDANFIRSLYIEGIVK